MIGLSHFEMTCSLKSALYASQSLLNKSTIKRAVATFQGIFGCSHRCTRGPEYETIRKRKARTRDEMGVSFLIKATRSIADGIISWTSLTIHDVHDDSTQAEGLVDRVLPESSVEESMLTSSSNRSTRAMRMTSPTSGSLAGSHVSNDSGYALSNPIFEHPEPRIAVQPQRKVEYTVRLPSHGESLSKEGPMANVVEVSDITSDGGA